MEDLEKWLGSSVKLRKFDVICKSYSKQKLGGSLPDATSISKWTVDNINLKVVLGLHGYNMTFKCIYIISVGAER